MGIGMLVHIISFYIPYIVFITAHETYADMNLAAKLLLCLVPNVGLAFAAIGMTEDESGGHLLGINDELYVSGDELTLGLVWLMFLVSAIVYALLVAYVDAINPGEFGQHESSLFCFMVHT